MSSLPSYLIGTSQKYLQSRILLEEQQQQQQQQQQQWKTTNGNGGISLSTSPFEDESYETLMRLQQYKANFEKRNGTNTTTTTTTTTKKKSPFIIGICGGSASGKTTVCSEIISTLPNKRVITVSQDSFYRDLNEEENELASASDFNFDSPDAFDYEAFEQTIRDLKAGVTGVQIPIYDFKTNSRLVGQTEQLPSADVVLVEGILVFYTKTLRDLMDMKLFVDTDADVSLARRIRRDIKERGRNLESVLTQYEKFVKTSFDDFIMPTKKYADVIIPRGGANRVAIDLITEHIKLKLMKNDMSNQ
jgi:uridine kinase